MIRRLLLLLFIGVNSTLFAQNVSHMVRVDYAKFTNKQLYMVGYNIGFHKINFSFTGAMGDGTDNRYLPPEQSDNISETEKVRSSQTIFPANVPSQTYLESCNSTYKTQQLRLGFNVFVRKNDTLGRYPCTGLHFGVDAIYGRTIENQTVVYKSEIDDTRFTYSGTNNFDEVGAASHIGWQFSFFKGHLYLDLRAVISFYYPFMPEPNLNGPFAGNKYEFQAGLGWRFNRANKADNVKDGDKDQIRQKI